MNTANDSIQVIDEDKVFNKKLSSYLSQYYAKNNGGVTSSEDGLNYHIVSVFGSQSTGKSTLLNHLFGTEFDVMNEAQRQQTTKGIWLAHADTIATTGNVNHAEGNNTGSIFVMDVEGTDGRERGEDQDFERKSALFALATSEVLLINIWEHQVGLYQGANMGLLKTVFEVNLSLFAKNKQKCLLLFVIRDHIGITPLENLSKTLMDDLKKIWSQLNKSRETENSELTDYFDLKFWALPHKLLQQDNFLRGVAELGDRFSTPQDLFLSEYHRHIPIDGWSVYAEQVWEQIELNKDLDLPTQQILVARFRCDEISANSYEIFIEKFDAVFEKDNNLELNELGNILRELRSNILKEYDSNASRYTRSVYLEKRKILSNKVDLKLREVYSSSLTKLSKSAIEKFNEEIVKNKKSKNIGNFDEVLTTSYNEALNFFLTNSKLISIIDEDLDEENFYSSTKELNQLKENLSELMKQQKVKELENMTNKIVKKFSSNFKETVVNILSNPTNDSWDQILSDFKKLSSSLLSKYKKEEDVYDFQLGFSADENKLTYDNILKKFWLKFDEIIHDYLTEDTVLNILKNKFETYFKYDENGLPKLWKTTSEIDSNFVEARSKTLDILPILSIAKLSSNVEILPDIDIAHDEEDFSSDEEEDFEASNGNNTERSSPTHKHHRFSHILSFKQQQSILQLFKKQIDLTYLDAKRSIIQSVTSIPVYFYALLLVLGANEIMAVLRNPILFTLVILLGSGLYICYKFNMLGSVIKISLAMVDQTKIVVTEKLKEILLSTEQHQEPSTYKFSNITEDKKNETSENIKLDDLDENGQKKF
ncbi:hypothetical protein PACTADRAFT_3473 [Pachysolen tannophilus NRRL Y-2460]|uniref:GB1/RHD3-type G domain-containing protein n=1 Tax=Pachysolen tannophilus NRRL Y-2460 TaxID=669874 RepID=A0A1E4TS71_PACTA|nr:hypothetical protein PACTADRAFT_3473 [Pachysolen tannophilus NRRL Y-2460]